MQGELSLETVAEIAIALAGFSGLIAMVRSGPVHEWHPRVRLAFWISLGWSVAAVVLSLLPSFLEPLGFASWAFLNGVVAVALTTGLVAMLRAHFVLTRAGTPTQNPWHWFVNLFVIVVGAIATSANAVGFSGEPGFAWYRFGVIACLFAALPGFLASFRVRNVEDDGLG